MENKVVKIKVEESLKKAIRQAVEDLGGIGKFVGEGDKVLIKPNFNTADVFPASSAFDFLAAVVDLCHEAEAEVAIGESCTYSLNAAAVMKEWGIDNLTADRPWLEVVNFDEGKWVKREVPGGKFLKTVSVPEALSRFDKLIFLPCLKTHKYAQFTGALKLSVGLMRPRQRMALHARHLQEKIAELSSLFSPVLTIMDGRKCFINKGPSYGEVREPGVILASVDRVAVDVEGIKIIQSYDGNSLADIEPREMSQIKRALELGVN